jgi:hypothetical protein
LLDEAFDLIRAVRLRDHLALLVVNRDVRFERLRRRFATREEARGLGPEVLHEVRSHLRQFGDGVREPLLRIGPIGIRPLTQALAFGGLLLLPKRLKLGLVLIAFFVRAFQDRLVSLER